MKRQQRRHTPPWIIFHADTGTYWTGKVFSIEFADAKQYDREDEAIADAAGLPVQVEVMHPHGRRSQLDRWGRAA